MDSMGETIGVFVGSANSFNVLRLISNIGKSLSERFAVHLIKTDVDIPKGPTEPYDTVYSGAGGSSIRGEIMTLRAYLQSHTPDFLFQVTNPPIHGSIVASFAAIHDIPFVYRYSGDRFYEYRIADGLTKGIHFGLNNVLGRYPLLTADAYVTLGPTGKRRLCERRVEAENISMIPPIVDNEKFSPDGPSADLDTDRYIGLYVGRLSERKGIKTVERTLPEILNRRENLQFVFVGEQSTPLNLPSQYLDHITRVGSVPPDEVPSYYRAADFLIHPSLTEGVPRAVLEALASNTPPIARDVGDISFATNNTFQTDKEFINLVCEFESLQVDSISPFIFRNISSKYRILFGESTS
jgi:glycosyltransferase involved in cell wall biosynthesis